MSFALRRVVRDGTTMSCWYDVWGSNTALREFSEFFLNDETILSVEC